jgi:predicted Zn-dependent protease
VQVLRRHRRHLHHAAARAGAAQGAGDPGRPRGQLRDDAHRRAARRAGLGVPHRHRLGLGRELAELPELLGEKAQARGVEPGRYDLVIDPTNLWLTIHESVGHATELDRALGYEAAYAGTSFATLDQLGSLRYGSPLMQVTGDRTTPHGLSTVAFDDEGVAAQEWDLVRDGVLVGYQLDRRMARQNAAALGHDRSNGCAFADSHAHVPIQRMPNVSLQPLADGPSTEEVIAGVERGIYVVGDKSWSIDMQRYNFQFTGQRFFEIRSGRIVGQLRDVAYQATTTEFWGSLDAARRSADLPARRRLQLRQGPAGADRRRLARLPGRAVPRRRRPQHRTGGRPMSASPQTPSADVVEQALALSQADGCVVVVSESRRVDLRWAGNTLTTNGAGRDRSVSVVSIVGEQVGTRSASSVDDLEALVRASEQAARRGGPRPRTPVRWSRPPRTPTSPLRRTRHRTTCWPVSRASSGERFAAARADGLLLYGYATHDATTTWLGTSTGVRRRHSQPTGYVEITGKDGTPGGHQRGRCEHP